MRKSVEEGSVIYTDEWCGYIGLGKDYKHLVVKHGQGQYVDGRAHVNTVEGFWSLLTRGIIGIYHNVSPKHLERCCDEFAFRYITRKVSETERFILAVGQTNGKHLKYRELTS